MLLAGEYSRARPLGRLPQARTIAPLACLSFPFSPPLKHLHQCQFGFTLGARHLNTDIDGNEVDVVLRNFGIRGIVTTYVIIFQT